VTVPNHRVLNRFDVITPPAPMLVGALVSIDDKNKIFIAMPFIIADFDLIVKLSDTKSIKNLVENFESIICGFFIFPLVFCLPAGKQGVFCVFVKTHSLQVFLRF